MKKIFRGKTQTTAETIDGLVKIRPKSLIAYAGTN